MSTYNPYTIDREADGDMIIVMCNGAELAAVDTIEEASIKAAVNMISGYPEIVYDMLHDVAVNRGQMLDNVVHMQWFRDALAEEIAGDWPSIDAVATPGSP